MVQGFPGQHTTETSVTVGTTAVNSKIRFDSSYVKTLPGILKCAQVILSLLGIICVFSTQHDVTGAGTWFNTVGMGGFWYSGILLSFYIFHIIEKFYKIPWIKIELIFCAIWTVCNALAGIFMASLAANTASSPLGAAAFFGFSAMVAYAVDTWLKYLGYKRGDLAQGERQPNKTVSSTTSPAY